MEAAKAARGATRCKTRCKARFWNDGGEWSGYATEVSDTDLYIETHTTLLKAGARIHLEVTLPHCTHFCEGVIANVKTVPPALAAVSLGGIQVQLVTLAQALQEARGASSQAGAECVAAGAGAALANCTAATGDASSAPSSAPLRLTLQRPEMVRAVLENDVRDGILFVATDKPLQPGMQVTVRITLPKPHNPVDVDGTVTRVRESPPAATVSIGDPVAAREALQVALRSGR